MKILFFGSLADKLGAQLEVDVPDAGMTVAELRRMVSGVRPEAAGPLMSPTARACIDQVIVPETARVLPAHEVAFVPPLSGG